jgi:hypothetical protein
MDDRIPTPGRERYITLTPIQGEANTYQWGYADQPIQEGTFLCKMTLLSDIGADKLGLPLGSIESGVPTPTVNEAFIQISDIFMKGRLGGLLC